MERYILPLCHKPSKRDSIEGYLRLFYIRYCEKVVPSEMLLPFQKTGNCITHWKVNDVQRLVHNKEGLVTFFQ